MPCHARNLYATLQFKDGVSENCFTTASQTYSAQPKLVLKNIRPNCSMQRPKFRQNFFDSIFLDLILFFSISIIYFNLFASNYSIQYLGIFLMFRHFCCPVVRLSGCAVVFLFTCPPLGILGISSRNFRILFLLIFDRDAQTVAHNIRKNLQLPELVSSRDQLLNLVLLTVCLSSRSLKSEQCCKRFL